jgi:site-specific recombinase XerD
LLSHLTMAGVDLAGVSKLLGHKDPTLIKRYAHLAPDHLSKALGAAEGLIIAKAPEVGQA